MTEDTEPLPERAIVRCQIIGKIVRLLQLLKFEVVYNSGEARIPEYC